MLNSVHQAEEAGRADGRAWAIEPLRASESDAAQHRWRAALETGRIEASQKARLVYLLAFISGARSRCEWQPLLDKAVRSEEAVRASAAWVEVLTTGQTPTHILDIALRRHEGAQATDVKIARQLTLEWHRVLIASEALSA